MLRWLNSQEEFAAAWTAIGVVMGSLITGFFLRRSKLIEANTAKELKKLETSSAQALEKERDSAAFQDRLLRRIEQLDLHVATLEEIAEKNQARITELESALGKANEEIRTLRAENEQLKRMLHCEKNDCPLLPGNETGGH